MFKYRHVSAKEDAIIHLVKHLNIKITGKVQGVGYRYWTEQQTERLNLNGFVRNEPDGSVYLELEGNENNLNEFIESAKKGSRFAAVENIDTEEGKIKGFLGFEVKFS